MPPRRGIWVILSGTIPTSFRSINREDLVPTLVQLQSTQTDVSLKWFERGQVWESPEAAADAARAARGLRTRRRLASRRIAQGSARKVRDLPRRKTRAV
jgi:hypothetical protein